MKHLNFLSSLGSQSGSHRVVTKAVTVGSPSVLRRGTILKHVAFLLLFLFAGFGQMWATGTTTYSLTPNQASTGSSATSYITTLTEFTYNNVSWKMNQWNPSTLQIKTNQNSAASEFRFYNTSAFSGRITKVVITFSALTVSDDTKLLFLGGSSEVNGTTGGTAGTWNSTDKTLTWIPGSSDNFTYFAFYQNGKAASGTNYLAESDAIVVTYEISGGGCTGTKLGTPEVEATISNHQVTLSWEADDNASSYQLKWNGGEWEENVTSPITKSNLDNGTAYTYQVQAIGDGNNYCDGDASAEASATPNLYHTVTWNTHNGEFTTTSVLDNTKPTFPKVNDADPTSCDNECKTFYGWATSSFYKTGDISAKTIYTSASDMPVVTADNVVYYAVFTDAVATDYSTTYTSNVAIDNNVSVVINSTTYDAKKLGKNGGGGSFTVSIPSGTTKLYLHAAGWNGKSASLTVSTNVGTISPSTPQSLAANSAISGSETTFTLTTLSNDFFEYSLSNVTSDATITITTTSERGVIWGVNATDGSASGDAHFLTNCCTPLGSINGSVSVSQTSATLTWDVVAGAEKYEYQIQPKGTDSDPDSWVEATSGIVVSDLTCGTEYTAYFRAIDTNNSHCSVGPESSKDFKTSSYSITLLNEGSVLDGEATIGMFEADKTTACSKVGTPDVVTLTATAETGYHFENWDVYKTGDATTKVAVNENAGVYTFTMPAYDVTVSTTFVANSTPTLPIVDNDVNTINSVTFANQEIGVQSAAQSIFLMAENLTADVTWTLSGDDAAYFAVSPASPIAQADAASQELEIKFTPNAAREFNAMLTFSSTGANDKVITLSGNGVNLYTVSLNLGGGEGLESTTGWTNDNGVWKQKQASFEAPITLPNATLSSGLSTAGWSFAGWKTEAVSSKTGDAQTFEETAYTPTNDITLYAVYSVNAGGTATDELNNSLTGITGSTYTAWSGKEGSASDAVYAGNSAGGNNSIQLRSDVDANKPASGIISTTSGGKAKKVTISWNSNTSSGRTLNVFGSNSAYTAVADLVDENKKGTLLGTIVNGTSTELTVTGDYAYIGLRSNSGAMYLDAVQITWSTASYEYFSNPSNKVSITYDANGGENAPSAQENITIGSNPTAATIGSLEKEGHTFSKWNTKADGTGVNYDAGGTITNISTDLTLYAIWTKNSYTITVTDPGNENAITAPTNNASIEYGAKVTLTASPANTHWSLTNWSVVDANETPVSLDEEGGVYSFNMPASNVTVSATFTEAAKRTVNFYINGGNAVQSGDVYVGETPSAPSVEAPECFGESNTFAGWATTPWTGTDNNPAGLITTLPEVEEGQDAINYYAVFCKGSSTSKLFEWEGGTSSELTALDGVSANGIGDYAEANAPYRVKFDGTNDDITIETSAAIASVAVDVKMIGGASSTSIKVQEAVNKNGTFTDVETLNISGKQNDVLNLSTTNAFASASRVVKLLFQKGSNGSNVGVGPITIMGVPSAATNYMTNCQADLGAIEGTVGLAQLTSGNNTGKLQATWTMASKIGLADNGIIIKIYKDGETPTLVKTSAALSKDETSYVATDLTPDYCSEYYATLTPVRVDATYKEGVEQGKSASNCVVGAQYTYTGNYSHVAPKEGETVAENSCSSFSVEFVGTESYTLPDEISVTGVSAYTWENGVLSFDKANVTGNVTITINGVAPAVTTLSATPTALNFGTPAVNESVTAQKFRISGVALGAGDITITSPNAGFTVSPSKLENIPAGNLEASAATEITVTPITTAAGEFNGNITISGGGASTTVALTMEVKEQYTVNWYVNGTDEAHKVHSQIGFAGTDFDEVPNDFSGFTDCSDYDFVGWKEGVIEGGSTTTEPSFATVGTTIPEANKNYFAVFAKGVSGGKAEGSFDLSSSNTNWVATSCVEYFNKPYGMKTANAKVVNNSIADFASYANTAEGISIKVNCFQNGGTTSRMTVSLVDADGNAIAGTGKEFTPTNASAVNGAEDSEVTYSASEVKNKNAKGYMMQLTTKDKNVLVLGTSYEITKANVYSKWYTTCPHITNVALIAGSASNGSISFEQGGSAVTSVRTDGNSAVEVDVVANIDEGYELTGLTLTSEDVPGATKNDELTKITIPAGQEGTLTVTPTITLIPKYSITFAKGDAAVTGADPAAMEEQYAGTPITLPKNNYTWTDHKYDGWKVTYVDANQQVQEVAISDNTFTMPAANVTITAQWIEYVTCAVNAYVNGTLAETKTVQSEQALALSAFGTPSAPEGVTGYTFAGWALNEESSDVASIEMLGTLITPEAGVASINIYAVFSRIGDDVTDVLTAADLAATGNSYVAFSDVQKLSAAKYAGASTKNGENIQIHSNGNPYKGIVSTVSGGLLKSISVTWGNGSNTLDVYASNTAYTEMGNLFTSGKQGTKVTSFTATGSYDFTTDYSYIGIRSNNNAIYLSRVEITWKSIYYTTRPGAVYAVSYDLGNDGNGNDGAWEEGVSHETINVKGGSTFEITSDVPVLEHYTFSGWTVNNNPVEGTITITGTTVITANWVAKALNNITYSDGATTPVTIVDANIEEGTEIILPSAADKGMSKSGYTFKGWKYANKLYKAGDTFIMPAEAVEFVAQWKKSDIETDKMLLVTEASALATGMQVALGCSYVKDEQSYFEMAGDITGTNKYMNSVTSGVTLSDGVATYTGDVVVMTLEQVEGGWKIAKNSTNYLTLSDGDIKWDTQAKATVWTISFEGNNVAIANGNNKIQFNSNSPRFKTYTSNQKAIQLFGKAIVVTEDVIISDLGYVDGEAIVASGEGVTVTIDQEINVQSITAKNGATIVIAGTATADDVVVDENSKIELTATVTAPVFRICTAPGQQATSGQVTGVSHVEAESIIMDVQLLEAGDMDADYWYSISAPFDVNVAGGFMTTGGRVLIHNVDFQIWSYAPDLYANGGRSWRRCADGVMHKNAAYLIGFDPDRFDNGIVPNVVRLKAAENTTLNDEVNTINDLQTQTSATLKPGYAWNGVANPNVYHINVGRDVQLWDNYSHGFLPATVGNNGLLDHDSYSFVVGTPFFCKDDGTHSIAITAATHGTEYTIPNEAPARNAAERYSFCVQIRKPGSRYYENRLYVRASEDALATFEDGKDMETLNETCNGHALIWTNAYGKRLAIEDAPLTNNQAMYDLTIMTPAAGTYVLRQASEVDGADLYVTYNGAIVWNLSLGDYEMDLVRGTTTGYGLLLVAQPNQMPTGVENGESLNGENGVQKILLNGNLYILRDGHLYDAVGKQAR